MTTREQWLMKLAKRMETLLFKPAGATFKKYRITCGWPSVRALSANAKRIGECWPASSSSDGVREIIISMALDDPMRVADVLAHEMVHAVDDMVHGHGKEFRKLALAIGLTGKMTATVAGESFIETMKPVLEKIGDYPHKALNGEESGRKKQTTRMIKAECKFNPCEDIGYVARLSRKWIVKSGAPFCPSCLTQMEVS